MKGFLVIALALLGIASSEPIRHKLNSHIHISPRSPVGTCPEQDPANPVYLPDSEDCGYYYECSNGLPVENNCPPDLEFSTSKNVCTQCEESGCKASIRHCSSEPPTNTTETTTKATTKTTEEISFYEVDGECPKRDTNETVILPDTVNCTIYYICSNGRAIPNVCPPTTVFDPIEGICVDELDYDCPIVPEEPETTTQNENETPSTVSEESVISVRKPDGECPEVDPPMSAYLPDKEDCTIYYECSNGIPVENECPPGLEFNPTLHVCDDPAHAGCKASTSTTSSTTLTTRSL